MTLITYQESDDSRSRPSSFASFAQLAVRPALKLREAWLRRQTERMIEGLDPAIRKDIGWPAPTNDVAAKRR